jgi:hypothetical protein
MGVELHGFGPALAECWPLPGVALRIFGTTLPPGVSRCKAHYMALSWRQVRLASENRRAIGRGASE